MNQEEKIKSKGVTSRLSKNFQNIDVNIKT
ncbi:hypothetical protein SRABI80_00324 [Peribacillus frigoritolerans]|nr:hypothetical protein SRABI80_00324 [Peribacillus frigoritolerans]